MKLCKKKKALFRRRIKGKLKAKNALIKRRLDYAAILNKENHELSLSLEKQIEEIRLLVQENDKINKEKSEEIECLMSKKRDTELDITKDKEKISYLEESVKIAQEEIKNIKRELETSQSILKYEYGIERKEK